jgi:hypothetical protein
MKEANAAMPLGQNTNMSKRPVLPDKTMTGLLRQLFQAVQHEDDIDLPEAQTFPDVKKLIS